MNARIRVATYNLHSCVGSDRRYDPERTLAVLKEINADVLGLQEVGGYLHDGIEQIYFFEKELGMKAVSGPNLVRGGTEFGNVLLVKGLVRNFQKVDLTVAPFEPRSAIDASVDIGQESLRVISTHLGLYPHERRQQINMISAALELSTNSVQVLMGDFNIFGPERIRLRKIGAPKSLPRLYSFPSRWPLMSLDRIWTIPNQCLQAQTVHRTALSRIASDHLPLVGEVQLSTTERLLVP